MRSDNIFPATAAIIALAIPILLFVGWIKCLYKFCNCDFEPSYKAEIVYGVGTFSGLGCIIGWMDINDKQSNKK